MSRVMLDGPEVKQQLVTPPLNAHFLSEQSAVWGLEMHYANIHLLIWI